MKYIDERNLVRHELIGLQAEVVASTHPGYVGIHGKVVDESKKMLTLAGEGAEKRVPKAAVVLQIQLPNGSLCRVDGRDLVRRPVERVKRGARRR